MKCILKNTTYLPATLLAVALTYCASAHADNLTADTTLTLNEITISAIKQDVNPLHSSTANTHIKGRDIEKLNIVSS